MIHLPNVHTFLKQFISALCDSLHNEVLKKGYNAEFSTINQLYKTAHMIEEASCYNVLEPVKTLVLRYNTSVVNCVVKLRLVSVSNFYCNAGPNSCNNYSS